MTESKPWMCADCRCVMVWQPDGYQKCPQCGVEVWYPDDDKRPAEAAKLLHERKPNEYLSRAHVPGTGGPGGSDPVGCTKKEKMQGKTTQTLYNQLFKQT